MRTPIWLFVAALALVGCDRWLTQPSFYNTVQVVATARNGSPIPGVALVLYIGPRPMAYDTTGPNGSYLFTRVPQGVYGVIAMPPAGYEPLSDLISAPNGTGVAGLDVADDTLSPVHFTFLERGPGTIVVRVTQSNGAAFANVPVTLYEPSKVDSQAMSDSLGRVVFNAVPFGVYGVSVTRPLFYQSFVTPDDSLYSIATNLIVDQGARDSVAFSLARCAGTVSALVLDQNGKPVPLSTTAYYTSTATLGVSVTDASGRTYLGPEPCATSLGVLVTPPLGYTVAPGRGTSFQDGITVMNDTTTVTLRVQKNP